MSSNSTNRLDHETLKSVQHDRIFVDQQHFGRRATYPT